MLKLCLYTKFPHQEIRRNYGTFRSDTLNDMHQYILIAKTQLDKIQIKKFLRKNILQPIWVISCQWSLSVPPEKSENLWFSEGIERPVAWNGLMLIYSHTETSETIETSQTIETFLHDRYIGNKLIKHCVRNF